MEARETPTLPTMGKSEQVQQQQQATAQPIGVRTKQPKEAGGTTSGQPRRFPYRRRKANFRPPRQLDYSDYLLSDGTRRPCTGGLSMRSRDMGLFGQSMERDVRPSLLGPPPFRDDQQHFGGHRNPGLSPTRGQPSILDHPPNLGQLRERRPPNGGQFSSRPPNRGQFGSGGRPPNRREQSAGQRQGLSTDRRFGAKQGQNQPRGGDTWAVESFSSERMAHCGEKPPESKGNAGLRRPASTGQQFIGTVERDF